jgi:hypothetical protein
VYYASLITAIGRVQITKIINALNDERAMIFYADTDSLIVNEFAASMIKERKLATIHPTDIGALKNEYPLRGNSEQSAIQRLVVFNKKIYQYMIDGEWHNKFKGCRTPSD